MAPEPEHDLDRIINEHSPAMLRLARRLVRHEADAEDVVQEALFAILETPFALSNLQSVGAWLFTLVRRRCIDLIRRRQHRPATEDPATMAQVLGDVRAEDENRRRELARDLAEALAVLPPECRFAFEQQALMGKPYRQIEAESGIAGGTLMARKVRAVEHLRAELKRRGWTGYKEAES